MPSDPFFDEIFGAQFTAFGILSDPPYTYIRDTGTATFGDLYNASVGNPYEDLREKP